MATEFAAGSTGGGECVLLVTALRSAEHCAEALRNTGMPVDLAATRADGLAALKAREYAVVVVDESLADADAREAELLWKHAGMAVPLQVNFAITGGSRLARDVRAALTRRTQEQARAMHAATQTMERELRSAVTGLLLQSELALATPAVPAHITDKLKLLVDLASSLKQRLDGAGVTGGAGRVHG